MNQKELIKEVAVVAETTQKAVKEVLDAVRTVILNNVKNEEVKVLDGLTVSAKLVDAHDAKNPQTGETIQVAATYKLKAKFGTGLKSALNA